MEITELELQAPDSERALIGAVAFHGDALASVLAQLPGADFYDLVRGTVWDTLRALSAEREPITPVTVARRMAAENAWSTRAQTIVQTEMTTAAPAVHAGKHAETVADFARRREMIQALNRARSIVASSPGEASDILASARAVLDDLDRGDTDKPVGGTLSWPQLVDEFEQAHAAGNSTPGIPSPWWELDDILGGLHPGRMYTFGGRPGAGKALALDTPIVTPTGWTTMGQIQTGDQVMGADGRPTTVTSAFDVRHGRPCFEVEFSDGSIIVADAEHLWLTETRASRRTSALPEPPRTSPLARDQRHKMARPAVVTTTQIAATLRTNTAEQRLNHSIPTCAPLRLSEVDLPLPPYMLGIWLGDGTSAAASYTSADPEIAMHIEAEGLRVVPLAAKIRYAIKLPEAPPAAQRNCRMCDVVFTPAVNWIQTCGSACGARMRVVGGQREYGKCPDCGGASSGSRQCRACWLSHGSVTGLLRTLDVLDNKHIPAQYLRASEAQRRALLAGLLDSDGTVSSGGNVEFGVTNQRLAADMLELALSLGYRAMTRTKRVKGRSEASSTAYTVCFATTDDVFRLERKRLVHKDRRSHSRARAGARYITAVRPVSSVPVRCIAVDNEDHLYLAGRSMIPTHNSTAALNIAEHAAVESARNVLVFSKEMPTVDVTGRFVARGAQVDLRAINHRALDDMQMAAVRQYLKRVGTPHLHVNASPVNLAGIKTLTRAHHHRHGLDVLVVDYLQLVHTDSPGRTREQEVGRVSRELKALAMELGLALVVPAQLNRGPAGRADARPAMSDLRDSGQIEQDSDAVILLWHQLVDGQPTGEVTFIVDKNRHGPKGEIKLRWHGGYGAIG